MAWIAVDKDGTEKLCMEKPFRRGRKCYTLWGLSLGFYSKNNRCKWANAWSTNSNDILPFTGVILPKGSIEILINRKLTWKDESVEI